MVAIYTLIGIAFAGVLAASVRVIREFERGVVLRLGRLRAVTRGPGLLVIASSADRTAQGQPADHHHAIPAQDGITRDNVTVTVDAVVYFRVIDPVKVVVDVEDYDDAVAQVAQASLRSIIGKSDLDDLLSNRERLNAGLALMIDGPAREWGVHVDRVEIKDVALPETMKRSMSRQAEAEREWHSRVITRAPCRASATVTADRRRGRCREELDVRVAVPRRAAPFPGTGHA